MKYTIVDPSTLTVGATVRVNAKSLELDLEHLDELASATVTDVGTWPEGEPRVDVVYESGLEAQLEAESYTWLLVEEGQDVVEVATEARRPRNTRVVILEVPDVATEDALFEALGGKGLAYRVLFSGPVGDPASF